MAKSLTIDQVKEKKIELESTILKLVQGFEKETGSYVSYMDFERKINEKEKASYAMPEPERKGPIENINVSMRFDL